MHSRRMPYCVNLDVESDDITLCLHYGFSYSDATARYIHTYLHTFNWLVVFKISNLINVKHGEKGNVGKQIAHHNDGNGQ